MKFLLLVFIYEAHGFASESSVWVLFSYTVTHTTQQSWNDTTTCRTLTIFIFKNVYFLTRSEVSGVNEATFRDDSLKWITRISSCLGAWDTFFFFLPLSLFFPIQVIHDWSTAWCVMTSECSHQTVIGLYWAEGKEGRLQTHHTLISLPCASLYV